jgi:5-(carboxyamino)imidazole ribonucleotide mutase
VGKLVEKANAILQLGNSLPQPFHLSEGLALIRVRFSHGGGDKQNQSLRKSARFTCPDCAQSNRFLNGGFGEAEESERVAAPQVGIIMGSKSDWETMRHAAEMLDSLGVEHETRIVSAHRTPKRLYEYAHEARGRGLKVIIAGAGGAAHLPGMAASMTTLPVLGVPVETQSLKGMDSLLSIVQMPAGVPVGTLAIGKAGAINAALLAAEILATGDSALAERLEKHRADQTASVADSPE